ncbi:MAG: hypothetical protein RIQ81_1804 [Pseudomonadota bacterium]
MFAKRIMAVATAAAAISLASTSLFAAELTVGSLAFSSQKIKADKTDAGSKSVFGVNGRYHDTLSQTMSWYAIGGIKANSYSSGASGLAPDNSMGIIVGGGARYYFSPFSPSAVPFGFIGGSFNVDSDATFDGNGYTETTKNGIYHSAGLGLRMALDEMLFFELESAFYETPLYAVEKTTSVTAAGESKSERTTMQLFAQTFGPFNNVFLSLGVRL